MAERKRSKDGGSDVEKFLDDAVEAPDHSGRAGGGLERKVGTRDERRQADRDAGVTRATKEDEKGEGNLGGLHGTGEEEGEGS